MKQKQSNRTVYTKAMKPEQVQALCRLYDEGNMTHYQIAVWYTVEMDEAACEFPECERLATEYCNFTPFCHTHSEAVADYMVRESLGPYAAIEYPKVKP